MENDIWFVASDPVTFTQFVVNPTASELVCACSVQPVFGLGQFNVSVAPDTEKTIFAGVGFTIGVLLMRRMPSVVSVLVFQYRPAAGVAGVMFQKTPEYAVAEKIGNASVTVSAGPLFTIASVPP